MFTLKLYRNVPGMPNHRNSKVISVDHVHTIEIGTKGRALEIQAFFEPGNSGMNYQTFYVGEPEEGMEAFGRDDNHLNSGDNSWWGWGLLENWEGNTSEHYRPASFG